MQARRSFFFSLYMSDGLGSVRLIVDEDGDAVANFSSNEFGVEEDSSGTRTDLNYMTYVGALGVRRDPSGLLYMRQRYYSPELGRWLSADPLGFDGGLNLYTYVEQNPVGLVDPEGLKPPSGLLGQVVEVVGRGFKVISGPLGFDDLVEQARNGADVLCKNQKTAKLVAEAAGGRLEWSHFDGHGFSGYTPNRVLWETDQRIPRSSRKERFNCRSPRISLCLE